jgi:hypothetical protein
MGGTQQGLGYYEQITAGRQTGREKFLAEIDKVLPWHS